jgi:hypothetical protein
MDASLRRLPVLVSIAVHFGCGSLNCTEEGASYSAHELHGHCCDGLVNYNLMVEPSDEYEGDDLPEGCGVSDVPESMMVCIACGDGVCGTAEHFCNCPQDCSAEDDQGTPNWDQTIVDA